MLIIAQSICRPVNSCWSSIVSLNLFFLVQPRFSRLVSDINLKIGPPTNHIQWLIMQLVFLFSHHSLFLTLSILIYLSIYLSINVSSFYTSDTHHRMPLISMCLVLILFIFMILRTTHTHIQLFMDAYPNIHHAI